MSKSMPLYSMSLNKEQAPWDIPMSGLGPSVAPGTSDPESISSDLSGLYALPNTYIPPLSIEAGWWNVSAPPLNTLHVSTFETATPQFCRRDVPNGYHHFNHCEAFQEGSSTDFSSQTLPQTKPDPCSSFVSQEPSPHQHARGTETEVAKFGSISAFPLAYEAASLSTITATSPSPSNVTPGPKSWIPHDVFNMGYQDENGKWRCRYNGCSLRKDFQRACDLRKHFLSHTKRYFCIQPDCPWSVLGFSTRKDCQRHQASHRPNLKCSALGCNRVFSRPDNMREHYRKIHQLSQNNLFPRPCRKRAIKQCPGPG